jgi:SGF29 tudor-like domain
VIVLHPLERFSKGDTIYAVYPDTTSFYQATVVQVPSRKQQQQQQSIMTTTAVSSSFVVGQPQQYVMVQFMDDADEFGITHDKAVPIQHIMLPPPQL